MELKHSRYNLYLKEKYLIYMQNLLKTSRTANVKTLKIFSITAYKNRSLDLMKKKQKQKTEITPVLKNLENTSKTQLSFNH